MIRKYLVPIAVVFIVLGCTSVDPARYVAILDELAVPTTWELAQTRVVTPDTDPGCSSLMGSCPRAIQYFLSDVAGADAYADAMEMLSGSGFEVELEISPGCDEDPHRTPACGIFATRGSDLVQVSLFNPGEDPDNVGVAETDRMQIRLVAEPK